MTTRFLLIATFMASAFAQDFDVVLAGGRVIDPESGLDAVRDVGIRGGKIAAISTAPLRGGTRVNAAGAVVAPGFIDLHAHGQLPENYRLQARDGVTTALELEIGVSPVETGRTPTGHGLEGSTAIVTGGAQGIGRNYCLALAGAGANIVVADLVSAEEVVAEAQALGVDAFWVRTDVSDEEATTEMAAAAVSRFGRIDVLVNNAGYFKHTFRGSFDEIEQPVLLDVAARIQRAFHQPIPAMRGSRDLDDQPRG